MMTQGLSLVGAFAMGIALGLFFFLGLWWTVQRLPDSCHPALLTLGSLGLRVLVCFLGFYLLKERWQGFLLALLGFLLVRYFSIQKWGHGVSHFVSKYDEGKE